MKPKDILTKKFLEKEYIQKKKSCRQIAKEQNVWTSSVERYVKKYNLLRDPRHAEYLISKEKLYEEYIVNNKSMKEIAISIGRKPNCAVIKRLLILYRIPIRKRTIQSLRAKDAFINQRTHSVITGFYWSTIKTNAKKRNLEFNITIEYAYQLFLKQNGKCALSGIEIKFRHPYEARNIQTTSLDRIDSSKGYVEGNVQWVHKTVNVMKMNLTQEEFLQWCKIIYLNNKDSNVTTNIL